MKSKKSGTAWICAALLGVGLAAGPAYARPMSVQVRQGPVRATPSFTGAVVATLAYGDRVQTSETKAGWIRVAFGEQTGWMHQSALTRRRIVLKAGEETAQTAASSEELALAGRGFNSEVEAQYREQNKQANYAAVDRMEKRAVSPEELAAFRKQGELK